MFSLGIVTCSHANAVYTSMNLNILDKVGPYACFNSGTPGSAFPGYLI